MKPQINLRNRHLKTIYGDGELDPEATIRRFRTVHREGSREVARQIEHYSLDAIAYVPSALNPRRLPKKANLRLSQGCPQALHR